MAGNENEEFFETLAAPERRAEAIPRKIKPLLAPPEAFIRGN
jgi:hypothetical protein